VYDLNFENIPKKLFVRFVDEVQSLSNVLYFFFLKIKKRKIKIN
jgi:hypothetical protein